MVAMVFKWCVFSSVSEACFKMLHVFYLDVAYGCNGFHVVFFSSVSEACFKMLHMFYLNVAYGCNGFHVVFFSSVSEACLKMLHVFYLDVTYGCNGFQVFLKCFRNMFQVFQLPSDVCCNYCI
jgi:hypothetical protein